MVVGSVNQLRDKTAVIRATSALRRDINRPNARCKGKPVTLSQLADHYGQRELASSNCWTTHSTKMGYRGYLRKCIIPRWGGYTLCSISEDSATHSVARLDDDHMASRFSEDACGRQAR